MNLVGKIRNVAVFLIEKRFYKKLAHKKCVKEQSTTAVTKQTEIQQPIQKEHPMTTYNKNGSNPWHTTNPT